MFTQTKYKQWFILLHRYLGLTMALFLIIAGVTGSVLAYHDELDEWLNPELFFIAHQRAKFLPPVQLFELANNHARSEQAFGESAHIGTMPLNFQPGRSTLLWVSHDDGFSQLFINPYNGELIGTRDPGDLSESWHNLAGFIDRLHYSLWLPDRWGILLMGIIGLLWTLDCFISLATTFPVVKTFSLKRFFSRWKRSWALGSNSGLAKAFRNRSMRGSYTFHFLLHRAAGLWLWGLLLIFAWSSVALNMRDVYQPMTYAALGEPVTTAKADFYSPVLDFEQALAIARSHAQYAAEKEGIELGHEGSLRYSSFSNTYVYNFNSDRDLYSRSSGGTSSARSSIHINAHNGELLAIFWPTGQYPATTVTRWLYALHKGDAFGWPYQLLVCLLGLMVAYFSYSGVVIWWKKRLKKQQRQR